MSYLAKSCLILVTLTLAAVFAEATPAVGDRAVFAMTFTKGSQSLTGKVSYELTAQDKSTDSWTQVVTKDFNGQKQTQVESVKTSDLLDDATINYLLMNCQARGGKLEKISVPAGDFDTCALPISNNEGAGTFWVAKVPFGCAKWTTLRKDGINVTALLEQYQHGSP